MVTQHGPGTHTNPIAIRPVVADPVGRLALVAKPSFPERRIFLQQSKTRPQKKKGLGGNSGRKTGNTLAGELTDSLDNCWFRQTSTLAIITSPL